MAGFAWGGFANGSIPTSALTRCTNFQKLPGETVGAGAAFMRPDAARQWHKMSLDCFIATGARPTLSEGYRDLADQERRYATYKRVGRPLAAYPRTSVHGWACSGDIGMAGRAWIRANAWKYGFKFTVPSEEWHMDYVGGAIIIGSGLGMEELIVALDAKDMGLFLNFRAYDGGSTISEWMRDMDVMVTSLFNATFYGGGSMQDGGKSISQSLADINGGVHSTVIRNGQDGILAIDPAKPISRSAVEDNAEGVTILRRLAEGKGINATVDPAALAKAISGLVMPTIDYKALAKAVNDDAAQRMRE